VVLDGIGAQRINDRPQPAVLDETPKPVCARSSVRRRRALVWRARLAAEGRDHRRRAGRGL